MREKLRHLDPLIHVVFLILIIGLFAYVFRIDSQIKALYNKEPIKTETIREIQTIETIKEIISTPFATPIVIVQKEPKPIPVSTNTGSRTSYIPMGSTSTANSTGWVDVTDSDVYIDLVNDFDKNAYVTFETSLKVANANGQAFARLKDVTHGIAVDGSEISTTNNADFIRVSSSKLNLWSGKNLYRVQLKSLNGFEITYSNGKIKLVY